MSCVAPKNAVVSARAAVSVRLLAGSAKAIRASETMSPICAVRSHARRCPSRDDNSGMRNLSTSGDQSHFMPQHNPTQLMKPMLLRSTPTSRIQNERVPSTNKSGSPELNPKKNMRKTTGSR